MMNIILLAPPAAGKGTQSNLLIENYKLSHISTGDLLREALNQDNDISQQIKQDMNSGKLVSDDIILDLVQNYIENQKSSRGFIYDGFPRNIKQAIALDDLLSTIDQKIDYVFYLKVDKELAKKRIIGRLSCKECGSVFNDKIENMKPLKEGICDNCGNNLSKRSDDNIETFEKRFQTYLTETEPLVNYYKDQDKLFEVDSNDEPNATFSQIENVMGEA